MARSTRPAPWWVALLAVLAVVASGCSVFTDDGDDESVVGSPETTLPRAATLLRVASGDWPTCLNPITCTDPTARTLVLQHVLPKLMEVDADGRYVPSPVLAGGPEVRVDDETGEQTITFVLAEEARWHDGRPITSSDVLGTWLAHLETPGAVASGYERITAVDDTDPLVARVTLAQPWPDWPELFGGYTGWLLQADAFGAGTDLSGQFSDFVPFGAGPYELASFDEQSLVLVAREEHWDPDRQADIDQVRIDRFADLGDGEATGRVSVPGSIDLLIPTGAVPEVAARFDLRRTPVPSVVGLFFDRRTAPLGSAGVRAAVDAALDRRDLVELAGVDPDELVTCLGWLPGEEACGEDLEEEGASAEETDALLEGDGWPVLLDGTRGRPDLPLATPVSYDPRLEGAEAIAEAVVEALVVRGFTASAEPLTAETWMRRDRESGTGIGVFAVRLGTAQRASALYRCDEGSLNPMAWCEQDSQVLSRELVDAASEDERLEIAEELGELAATSLSWLPLHQRTVRWLVDPDRIITPDQAPLGAGPLGALHDFDRADR
ncbi:ABC transporter substrate-binding protein [Acidimicrobiia bacterium EGI L10123]|uniref:ABC transporter substrate-binding protein n=1 Tax=Salinilacustrithrix flava TaxID=2957203 RepID=UPI003D7C1A49|nr:ABC transporter substrate-binding protein [Acidimicrobiia bacterium EGI L10123]